MDKNTYLREQRMTSEEAGKILGLSAKATAEEVRAAYRKASMSAHPDRGGSTEAMQNVNAAYDLLKGGFQGAVANRWEEYKARKEAYEQAGAQLKDWFVRMFKPENFQKYFKEIFGQDFDVEYKEQTKGLDSYAGGVWNFKSLDGEVWFEYRLSAFVAGYFHDRQRMISGNPDSVPVAFQLSVDYMTNNRKQVIKARDYSSKTDAAILWNPELTFPRDKLVKGMKNKSSKFTRRHFDTALKAKWRVTQNKDHYYIRTSSGVEIVFWRSTFLGMAAYSFLDARDLNQKGVRERLSGTFPETEAALTGLIDLFKRIDKMPLSQIPNTVKAFADSFRT